MLKLSSQISEHILCKNCPYKGTHLVRYFRQQIPLFAMPENNKRSKKKSKDGSDIAYLQILGSGAKGAAKSLYFFADCGYMFNCGEGTHRIINEHRIKIAPLEHVFVTHLSWSNIGGLIHSSLTAEKHGTRDFTLHGPPGLEYLFASVKEFVTINHIAIETAKCSSNSFYEDAAVKIQYVPLTCKEKLNPDNKTEKNTSFVSEAYVSQEKTDYCAHTKTENQSNESPQKFSTNPGATKIASSAMNYICKLKPKLNTLDLDLCVEYGVPPGPLLGKLRKGEDVVLPGGSTVKFTDVACFDLLGQVFIVVDCPSIDYLDELLNEEKFKEYQIGAIEENLPKHVFHFTPSHVMNDEKYQNWMKRFPDGTDHVNLNDSNTCLGNVGVHILQRKLNYLDSEIFPLLGDQSIPIVDVPCEFGEFYPVEKLNIPPHVGHTLKFFDLRNAEKFASSIRQCIYMNPQWIIEKLCRKEEFESSYNSFRSDLEAISSQVKSENEKTPYPIITFLGTGSAQSMKFRNVSGLLITLSDDSHIILDCGEGTYGQIVRFFGPDEADRILASTKAIYVSHSHIDHHLGAISLLQKRREAVKKLNSKCEKCYFLAPKGILFWIHEYDFHFESILDCLEPISNDDLLPEKKISPEVDTMLKALNVKEIKTCEVRHCAFSYGISIIDSSGRKITYSGDTMPADSLVELGQDSDLLIHEATFEDAMSNLAETTMHSTTSEAIATSRRMNAKFTILTHFSQRYSKIPVITEHFDDKIGIAFDNMRVRFGDFKKLPLLNSFLKIVFSEEQKILESKTMKHEKVLKMLEDI